MSADPVSIRILACDNNDRGDIFNRLMSGFFVAMGYGDVRLNVARSGSEIDIEATHLLENRKAVAECKAVKEKIGGAEINKFRGAVQAQPSRASRRSPTPYFISLSGFTETAVDQEIHAGKNAVILVNASQAVQELIRGRMLVSVERATATAGQLAGQLPRIQFHPPPELLAHHTGWIWAIYFSERSERTHVVFVHADGSALSSRVARQVIEDDRTAGGSLYKLTCLNPEPTPDDRVLEAQAREQYQKYLFAECGQILLDGLPADGESSSRRLQLENLFIPLHLTPVSRTTKTRRDTATRIHVGNYLAAHSRIAVLAPPGSGKSTLLNRLAVAYSDQSRRQLVEDQLPDRTWLPILLRCRDLRQQACAPLPEIIAALGERACLGPSAAAFGHLVGRALQNGEILLLVDGLDEIAEVGNRSAFVRNLVIFLTMYPNVSLVVTAREAGFRHVAQLFASVCEQTSLSEFDPDDIRRLTVAWHRELFGGEAKVIADAQQLANSIIANDRIRLLAGNPLLLTTLLLVKRWLGQLPTRRTVLYGKAVEVLLMTWNVIGHDPIDQDEALPQLCYVAYSMMKQGIQTITRPELARLLRDAREQLVAELAYARTSISDFIDRLEYRSSLMTMIGNRLVNGSLSPIYEFRHLTFQEYLTAKALVEGWYPGHHKSDTLATLLEPHITEARWLEVIPLAAVLGGRKADVLIRMLAEAAVSPRQGKNIPSKRRRSRPQLRRDRLKSKVSEHTRDSDSVQSSPVSALWTCLADEVQLTPETLGIAARSLITSAQSGYPPPRDVYRVLRGKFATVMRDEALVAYSAGSRWIGPASILASATFASRVGDSTLASLARPLNTNRPDNALLRSEEKVFAEAINELVGLLASKSRPNWAYDQTAMSVMGACYFAFGGSEKLTSVVGSELLHTEVVSLQSSPVYRGCEVAAGDGSGVVIIPELLCHDLYLREMHAWLQRIGYRPYLSGIGFNADCFTLLMQKHLTGTIDKACRETGRNVHLIGHGLGGTIARSFAALGPTFIASVITLGAPIRGFVFKNPYFRELMERIRLQILQTHGSGVLPDCYTGRCTCNCLDGLRRVIPDSVVETTIYTHQDGFWDWRSCVTENPNSNFEVAGTHVGLVVNPLVYEIIAKRLAEAPARRAQWMRTKRKKPPIKIV